MLSMDVITPFFDSMGLAGAHPERLVPALRREIVRVRREFAQPNPVAYDPRSTLAALEDH